MIKCLHPSKSQNSQEPWVMKTLNYLRGGFFVELGAADGLELSNTFVLERSLHWQGICIEPEPTLFKALAENRKCSCVNYLVGGAKRKYAHFQPAGLLSGVVANLNNNIMVDHNVWVMHSHSLEEVLKKCNSPSKIDYLSLDVEGSEYEILLDFPWEEYHCSLWTIEHNAYAVGCAFREKIHDLLLSKGYKYVTDRANSDSFFCSSELYESALAAHFIQIA